MRLRLPGSPRTAAGGAVQQRQAITQRAATPALVARALVAASVVGIAVQEAMPSSPTPASSASVFQPGVAAWDGRRRGRVVEAEPGLTFRESDPS
ncbi:hypothetical protein [Phytoactinopolyspora limicola]|uniref:hypothetical protein n=1 Tax=Phytoactinopolyspora limicola TaxID=2715536 RepID=UPI001407D9C2|nr:hypothetical protein [Phytoactinopolyspora limicola]